ncbi:MAG: ferritin family protein [Candidatus Zixiibacteriota bacterium]|jgi:rubrerythrin
MMDIFEFAMKMEQDGQAFYEKMAGQSANAALKNILQDLAHDEVKHYNIFKRFRDGDFSAASEMQSSSKVFQRAKNVFESIAAKKDFKEFPTDVVAAWKKAQEIEKKSEDFYREKAASAENEKARKTIMLIADEEHKHWALIENVLQFLERPKQWLEDAEWNNLDRY